MLPLREPQISKLACNATTHGKLDRIRDALHPYGPAAEHLSDHYRDKPRCCARRDDKIRPLPAYQQEDISGTPDHRHGGIPVTIFNDVTFLQSGVFCQPRKGVRIDHFDSGQVLPQDHHLIPMAPARGYCEYPSQN
ncbi:hypothetical protein D3C87_1489560 [compost metagenome]